MRHDAETRFGWHRVVCLAVAQEIFLSVSWTSSAVSLAHRRASSHALLPHPRGPSVPETRGTFPKTEQQNKTSRK